MSISEQQEILKWVSSNLLNPKYKYPNNRININLYDTDSSIPQVIWNIKQRILDKEGLRGYDKEPLFGDFCAGILYGGFIHPHRDEAYGDTLVTRANVFILNPNDRHFQVYYKGFPIQEKERHYVICRSNTDLHWSNTNTSHIPRITLSFGFLLPKEKRDAIVKPLPFHWYQYIHYLIFYLYSRIFEKLIQIPHIGKNIYYFLSPKYFYS